MGVNVNESKPRPTWRRRVLQVVLLLVLLGLVVSGALATAACRSMGQAPRGERLLRMKHSPIWSESSQGFKNRMPQVQDPMLDLVGDWVTGGSAHRVPETLPPVLSRTRADFDTPPATGLRVTWLGHSTLLVEIDGARVLVDPVWGPRASPWTFLGPARWYPPPLPLDELPDITAVVISHDHYDHLDLPTVDALKDKDIPWVVPLGVGAHLEYWGVPTERVFDLDWWEAKTLGGLTLTATPARHFSGRSMPGENGGPTLWAGWAMTTDAHRVYYSGDTAMFEELLDIGKRLGPFDITMIETGAYNKAWADVHMGPEQAVRAHRLVRGEVFLPVHWGLFDLALHGWTEPIERVLVAAEKEGVTVVSPPPGGSVEPAVPTPVKRWWPDVPWDPVEVHAAFSSGTAHLMRDDAVPAALPAAADDKPAAVLDADDGPLSEEPAAVITPSKP